MEQQAKPTVLVVDDNIANLDLLFTGLQQADFRVILAEDGYTALERVDYLTPDIILLDVRMPDINGFELCRHLKNRPQTAQTPVIFLTVLADTSSKLDGFQVGAVDYITKPFLIEEVIARVKTHLTWQQLQKEIQAKNIQLEREINGRKEAQQRLREAYEQLEKRVEARTRELAEANKRLQAKIEEHSRIANELELHKFELEIQNEELRTTQHELEISHENYRNLYEFAPVSYFTFDDQGRILEANQTGANLLNRPVKHLHKKPFVVFVSPLQHDVFFEHLQQTIHTQTRQTCELTLNRVDGTTIEGQLESVVVAHTMNAAPRVQTAVIDISQRKQTEAELAIYRNHLEKLVDERTTELTQANQQLQQEIAERNKAEAAREATSHRLATLIELIEEGITLSDENGNFEVFNKKMVEISGYTKEEANQNNFLHLLYPDPQQRQQVILDIESVTHGYGNHEVETVIQTKDGHSKSLLVTTARVWYDNHIWFLSAYRDITRRKKTEDELRKANQMLHQLATIDGLTQIANRRYFTEYLSQKWEILKKEQQSLCLILGDIDYFKIYNDTYGHQSGDYCLQQIAQAFNRAARRAMDLVARYGGEELAVILPYTNAKGGLKVAATIQSEIAQLQIQHHRSEISEYVTVSIGVAAVIPQANLSAESLITWADKALYEAKHQGRNRIVLYQSDDKNR